MKLLCRLAAISVLSMWVNVAGASPLDFKANILDPPAPSAPTFPTFIISASPFEVAFSTCVDGELPNGLKADGCFAGVNRTGLNWTSLQVIFPNDLVLDSQPVDCSLAPSDNIFFNPRCSVDEQQYTLILWWASQSTRRSMATKQQHWPVCRRGAAMKRESSLSQRSVPGIGWVGTPPRKYIDARFRIR